MRMPVVLRHRSRIAPDFDGRSDNRKHHRFASKNVMSAAAEDAADMSSGAVTSRAHRIVIRESEEGLGGGAVRPRLEIHGRPR
jgi:hypothetical protein